MKRHVVSILIVTLAMPGFAATSSAQESASQEVYSRPIATLAYTGVSGKAKPPGAALAPGSSRLDAIEMHSLQLGRSLGRSICLC